MRSLSTNHDLFAYQEARKHILRLHGVSEATLMHYLTPPPARLQPKTLADVYFRLIESAQNATMMPAVIGGSVGSIKALRPVLCEFAPGPVSSRYDSWQTLLNTIEAELKPRGKIRRERGSLWPRFTQAALSGAHFLAQFADLTDFLRWVRAFDDDRRSRAALPLLISHEVHGFGFALACDFLKELGFFNFAKPDVHVITILKELELCDSKADPYLVFKAVVRIASSCNVTPYHADKLFWLVGSGNYYDHRKLGKDGRVSTDREGFIRDTHDALWGAQ